MITAQSILEGLKAKKADDDRAKASGRLHLHHLPIPLGPGIEQLAGVLNLLPSISIIKGPWVAGGAARRLQQGLDLSSGDIDLFFFSIKQWTEYCEALEGFEKVYVSENAITFLVNGLKVQLIKRRTYESVAAVLEDFDFTVCQIATDGTRMMATDDAIKDINAKKFKLAEHGRTCHQTAISRFTKYVNYGFVPEPGLYPKIIRKTLDRTGSYQIFQDDSKDDDAWYDGATSEPNTPTVTEDVFQVTSGGQTIIHTIARALGFPK